MSICSENNVPRNAKHPIRWLNCDCDQSFCQFLFGSQAKLTVETFQSLFSEFVFKMLKIEFNQSQDTFITNDIFKGKLCCI